jgi:hypothetical protein
MGVLSIRMLEVKNLEGRDQGVCDPFVKFKLFARDNAQSGSILITPNDRSSQFPSSLVNHHNNPTLSKVKSKAAKKKNITKMERISHFKNLKQSSRICTQNCSSRF